MIDDVRERNQQQAEQKQETEQGQEKKNIETLKEQRAYQQNPPKVEFNGVQPSGTDEQRAAFLERVKETREQQTQQQQDKQREI